jgi:hypothetical protein
MKAKFAFYEVVKLRAAAEIPAELTGKQGVILGMTCGDDGKWNYTVQVEEIDRCRCIDEGALESTGQFKRREDVYSGESLQVSTDAQTGEGKIVTRRMDRS